MQKNITNINNKLKQYSQKTWGKPDKKEQKKELNLNELEIEVPKHKKLKRTKREKKVFIPYKGECPFCHKELEKDESENLDFIPWVLHKYKPYCKCGATEVDNCPCCNHTTWFKDGYYKHQHHGCGYYGKRIYF